MAGVTGLMDEGTLFGQPVDDEPQPKKPTTAKEPANIADTSREEVLQTIRKVFGNGMIRDRETAIKEIATELGFQRVGKTIREELDNDLQTAVRRGILQNERGELSLLARNLEEYDRTFLKEQFLSAMGRGWVARDEAYRQLARHMGFARTGKSTVAVGKSLVNGLLRTGELEREGVDMVRRTA
jgi:hypothetical protein